jgi:hypothetical protein
MSTLAEIQEAVSKLGSEERKALSVWLESQAEPDVSSQEDAQILRSLDEALRIDASQGAATGIRLQLFC